MIIATGMVVSIIMNKVKKSLYSLRVNIRQLSPAVRYLLTAVFILFLAGGVTFAQMMSKPNPETGNGLSVPEDQNTPSSSIPDTSPPPVTPIQETKVEARVQCETVDIPSGIEYRDADWLYKGETYSSPGDNGHNGKEKVCKDASGKVVSRTTTAKPYDKIVHVGTKKKPPPEPATPQYTFDEALSLAKQTCQAKGFAPDSTDMSDCKTSEMKKYGY